MTHLYERSATAERGVMLMAEQIADAALRRQIAQWTRAALGQLVEDDGSLSQAVAEPIVMRYSTRRGVARTGGTQIRKKEWSHAYSCGRGRATPGVFAAPRSSRRASHRRSRARRARRS